MPARAKGERMLEDDLRDDSDKVARPLEHSPDFGA